MPGAQIKLCSADCTDDPADAGKYAVEYLNTLNPTGLPRHSLLLKPGIPLMLTRNLEPKKGLCNGTRMIFQSVTTNGLLLHCTHILEGERRTVAIPRIMLRPKDREFPFEWSRRQFPVRVAFATTINKSQGQTLKRVGVWLPHPVFTHGQLYVAASRVGAPEKFTVAIKPEKDQPANTTKNIVFQEVLLRQTAQPPLPEEPGPMLEPVTAEEEEWLAQMDVDFPEEPEDHLDLEEDSLPSPRRPPHQHPRAALPRLSRSPARLAMPPPPTVPDEMEPLPPLPETPKGDYELF